MKHRENDSAALTLAREALSVLAQKEPELADSLKKVLPAYALQQEKTGAVLTPESLLTDARKGVAWLQAQRPGKSAQAQHTPLALYQQITDAMPRPLKERLLKYVQDGQHEEIKAHFEQHAVSPALLETLFMAAAEHGAVDLVALLYQKAVDLHEACNLTMPPDEWQSLAMTKAGANNHLDVVKYLHQNGADIHKWGNLALHKAVPHGHLNVVTYLHQKGADIQAWDNWAIVEAASRGYLDIVTYLHQSGVDIRARDNKAMTSAASGGYLDLVKYLHQNGTDIHWLDNLALFSAAAHGHMDVVTYLHRKPTDVQAQGNRAITDAASEGHLDVVIYLHKNGADISALDNLAMCNAATNGHLDVVTYLHQNGADIQAQGNRPITGAASKGHLDVVTYLHQNGADIFVWDNQPLLNAATNGHLDVVAYLHQNGADIHMLPAKKKEQYHQYLQDNARWQKTLRRDPPKGVVNADPAFFKEATYHALMALLAAEGYSCQNMMAFNAAGLFQSTARVMQYFKTWGRYSKQPLHDITYMIKLPPERGDMNVKDWGDAVLKLGPDMARLVKFADRIPSPARSADGRSWSYHATRAICAQFNYKRAAEHPALAGVCFEHNVSEDDFNKALHIVLSTPPVRKNMPDIYIKGERFDMPGAKFYRLPADDVRGLFLGEFTDCCQSIGSDGAACATYGYKSENGGFYVVENAKGLIVSQTFAWRAQGGGLCFDTLETLGENVTSAQWAKILQETARELAQRPDHDLTQLSVGMGGGTPESLTSVFNQATRTKPLDYKGYSEAQKQIMVWQRNISANTL